jgi:hypothetical protein
LGEFGDTIHLVIHLLVFLYGKSSKYEGFTPTMTMEIIEHHGENNETMEQ